MIDVLLHFRVRNAHAAWLYCSRTGRKVKGHVVQFYIATIASTANLNLASCIGSFKLDQTRARHRSCCGHGIHIHAARSQQGGYSLGGQTRIAMKRNRGSFHMCLYKSSKVGLLEVNVAIPPRCFIRRKRATRSQGRDKSTAVDTDKDETHTHTVRTICDMSVKCFLDFKLVPLMRQNLRRQNDDNGA